MFLRILEFETISGIYLNKKEKEKGLTWSESGPWPRPFRHGGRRSGVHRPDGTARPTRGGWPMRCPAARRARRRGHRAMATRADVPGKESGGGAHSSSGASVERWGGAARWRAAVVELAWWSPMTRP
jgi:hypothetical protein